jgi:hypothetical protein
LDLHFRLPGLGARVLALEVRAGHARYVARKTRDLTADQAAEVDAAVAEVADGRLHWSRFEDVVAAAIVAADPEAARRREAEAAQAQFATPTHSDDHGMRGFYVRADFATIARIDATVAYLADALAALGDRGSLDDRRVKAVLVMANPTRAVELLRAYAAWPATGAPQEPIEESTLLPAVVLYVHLAHQGRGVTRVEGERPLTETWLRETLVPRCRFKVTPVLDLAGQTPVDALEIPDRHRRAVHLMTPADTFHPDHRGKNRRT